MSEPTGIEALVCADIARRQAVGIRKYGKTVAENPLPLLAWLQHGYEEALDLAIYLRRAMAEIEEQTPGGTFGEAYVFPPNALAKGRNEAAEAISLLIDAQKAEILTLRERVAAAAEECQRLKDGVVQDLAVTVEVLRFTCEHAEYQTERTLKGMSVGMRALGRNSDHIKEFQTEAYWQRVWATAKGGA